MPESKLRVRDLRKTFHPGLFEASVQALRGVTFAVGEGEVFGFLGPNGAGKTTTIKAILGLVRPDAGEITVCGLPHTASAARRRLGFAPESPAFYQHLSGSEFLEFCAALLRLPTSVARARAGALLERVGMAAHAGRPMRTYSKGMLQRVSLAQALLGEPELLILDEPMSGLDPLGRSDVRDLILEQKRLGTTVFFSSHIIPDVETICDHAAVLVEGEVRAVGSVRDLLADEAEAYEVTFVGTLPAPPRTPVTASHAGSDVSWLRVSAERRDDLVRELSQAGVRVVSLVPVRSSLEAFLLRSSGREAS
jgi:ABC-2 type transport system ATP-binding protein